MARQALAYTLLCPGESLNLQPKGPPHVRCALSNRRVAQVTVSDVMLYARDHLLTERPELFMKGNTVYAILCHAY